MEFLDNTDIPGRNNQYLSLEQGLNKFRIVGPAITGYEIWKDNPDGGRQPVRQKLDFTDEQLKSLNADTEEDGTYRPAKFFWAFPVWNYNNSLVQIAQFTQKSILKSIKSFMKNEEYGNPLGYDITVTKTGDGMLTKYEVVPSPPKDVSKDISDAVEAIEFKMSAMYDGENPFQR